MRAAALLVAAGSGERLGAGRPKAFVVVAGRPMLDWSLDALRAAGIADVVVAGPAGADALGWAAPRGVTVVPGGATRSASVAAALAAAPAGADAIVVHDAARPLVDPALFGETLAALEAADAAVAAAPVTDTIKEAGPDRVVERTLDRARLWAIQTPQAFRRAALERALDVPADVLAAATDDAWLVERAGGRVVVIPATARNLKVTTPFDLEVAERLLSGSMGAPSC
jgi:2-C-methyl-D-erythritol 4-phosphate cytidylyltransferase